MSYMEIRNLKKVYNPYGIHPKVALNGLDFEVEKGDFICIMGASGSGKTTLVNILSTIDEATHGQIFLNQKDLLLLSEKEKANLRKEEIGFIFQNYNLIESLTVKNNILFSLRLNKVDQKIQLEKLNELTKMLNIEEIIDKYQIHFDEKRNTWEDRIFIVEFLKYCKNYYCMDECFYNYVSVPNSLSRRYNAQYLELILANYNLYVELFGEDYDFSAQYATDYWCRSIENMIIQQLRVKDQHPEVIQNIKKILKELQVKTWYKNRTKKDQIDYEISQCLKENEYDRVVEIYENKLEVFQKQERKASRNQMLRRIVRKLKIRKN